MATAPVPEGTSAVRRAWAQSSAAVLAMADLRLADWFLWITPLLTALSSFLDAARSASFTASLSPEAAASRKERTLVFSADLTDLLRRRRFSLVALRLIWDLMLATRRLSRENVPACRPDRSVRAQAARDLRRWGRRVAGGPDARTTERAPRRRLPNLAASSSRGHLPHRQGPDEMVEGAARPGRPCIRLPEVPAVHARPSSATWDDGEPPLTLSMILTRYPQRVTDGPHGPHAVRHPAGEDPELLHHRAHRPREVDAGRPDAADDRGRRRAPDARPVPRPDGHRARARHHDQVAGRAHAVGGRGRDLRPQHDRHARSRGLHVRGLPLARGVRGRGPARRRGAGHRGADPGEPLPRHGERAHDHSRPQQDRPAGGAAREVRRGARQAHRGRARDLPARLG